MGHPLMLTLPCILIIFEVSNIFSRVLSYKSFKFWSTISCNKTSKLPFQKLRFSLSIACYCRMCLVYCCCLQWPLLVFLHVYWSGSRKTRGKGRSGWDKCKHFFQRLCKSKAKPVSCHRVNFSLVIKIVFCTFDCWTSCEFAFAVFYQALWLTPAQIGCISNLVS